MPDPKYYEKHKGRLNNSKKIIAVEGEDDASLVSWILKNDCNADPADVGIIDVGGTANFSPGLSILFKSPGITAGTATHLLILFDADDDPTLTYGRIKAVTTKHGLKLPPLGDTGSFSNDLYGGIFSFPDSINPGDLESFCLATVKDSELEKLAANFFTQAKSLLDKKGGSMNGSQHKRIAQAYLSGCTGDLVRGAGLGFSRGHFDSSDPMVKKLSDFIKKSLEI